MKIIDTHTHLYLEEFDGDFDKVVEKSVEIGVEKFIFPSIHSKYNDRMISSYNKNKSIFEIMAGYILHMLQTTTKEFDLVINNLNLYKCVAVGEIGIDLYWKKIF